MSEHTKPWIARPVLYDGTPNGEWEVVVPDATKPTAEEPWYLATIKVHDACDDLDTEETARLIAAAPELLEALREAVEDVEYLRRYANNNGGMFDNDVCDYGRAAIAKAEGRS